MKMKNRLSHIIALMIIASGLSTVNPSTSRATAYMLSEGEQRYSTGLTYATANDFFDMNRNRIPQGCRSRDWRWHHNYTYGYSYYYNFFASGALINQECGPNSKVAGIGDIKVGVRGRLDKFRNGRTWELALFIPTGYNNQKVNRLGFGRLGIWGGLAWSTQNSGWEAKMPSYWEVGTGIVYWVGSPATQSRSYLKKSWRLDKDGNNRIVLQATLKLSLRDGKATFPAVFRGFPRFSGDYDLFSISAKYSHRISKEWSVAPTIGTALWGRNTSVSTFIDLQLTRQWN
jgi:hypothetical protein